MTGNPKGRPKKPTGLKIVIGGRDVEGHRAIDTSQEPTPKICIPTAPPHLNRRAKIEWRRVSKILIKNKLLTEMDRTCLAVYCAAYARWAEAETALKKTGFITYSEKGTPLLHPLLTVIKQALEQMNTMMSKMGMSPADRARVKMEDSGPPRTEMEGLLSG